MREVANSRLNEKKVRRQEEEKEFSNAARAKKITVHGKNKEINSAVRAGSGNLSDRYIMDERVTEDNEKENTGINRKKIYFLFSGF